MSYNDILNNSGRLYKDYKDICIQFMEKVEKLVKGYEIDFPPVKDESKNYSKSEIFHGILEKLQNEKIKILVTGQFKVGKSTLINALLGEEVLPAFSTPCTAVITEITYGEQKKAVISFKKQIMGVPDNLPEKVKKHIGNRRENIPDLIIDSKNLETDLEKYLVIPEDEDKEQKESVAESPYLCCRLSWPLELCRNGVEIIDTPGLNEANARDETLYKYVPQADMVLHVMSPLQLFGKPDREFLDKLQYLGEPNVIFLVNRFDQLNSDKVREQVKDKAMKIFQDYTKYGNEGIFFVSSWLALNARMENDETLYANTGFKDLERQIATIIEKDRIKIKLGQTIFGACNELDALAYRYIPDLRNRVNEDISELEKIYQDRKKDLYSIEERKIKIQHEVERCIYEIRNSFYQDLRIFFRDFAVYLQGNDIFKVLHTKLSDFNKRKGEDIKIILSEYKDTLDEYLVYFNEIPGEFNITIFSYINSEFFKLAAQIFENKLSKGFIPDLSKKLYSEADNLAFDLSKKLAEKLDEQKQLINDKLESRVHDNMLPVEEAIRSLENSQKSLNRKIGQLDNWQKKFSDALADGCRLQQSI